MLKKRDQVNEREEKRETTHFPLCPFVITVRKAILPQEGYFCCDQILTAKI